VASGVGAEVRALGDGKWGPPGPGEASYRPERPWDLTEIGERDWFGALGDGLVVVYEPAAGEPGVWTTARGAWLHLSADGMVTALTGKVDVGQDNRTALRLLVAEELGVPVTTVRIAMGDTDLCPFDAGTFGSRSMPDAGSALRRVAAFARGLRGPVPGERRVEIATGEPVVSDPAGWRQAGRVYPVPGMDGAVTGARCFVADLTTPGMLHGVLLRPPVPGSALRSVDVRVLDGWPRVTFISDGEVTGVVAADLAAARDAIGALAATARWDVPAAPSDTGLSEYLRSHPADGAGMDREFRQAEGSAATALEMAEVRCEATYEAAYIATAALETRAALAEWADDGRLTVWTGTQTPFSVREQVAAALGIEEAKVRIIVPPTGGAFGGKHRATVAIEAATLARKAGRPVRVAWSRAEEFAAGGLRRAAVIDVTAGATADGKLSGWTFLNVNAGTPGIGTPYLVADHRIEYQPAVSPLIQGSYRALAATANNFARESMIDELACALGADAVEFRLANLADERLAAVLLAVAERVGWDDRRGGGWGIACGLEKNGRVATAVQVEVAPDHAIRVVRLVSGYECGAIVNRRAVTAQVEGAAVMALGGALFEKIEFTGGEITNAAFSGYRVPRIGDVPPVEVVLLDRPDLPSAGAGETPMIAVAPAVAAAVFDATGQRLRSLPLTLPGS
jgi:isoquinoline 1-oxidoreductase